MLAKGETYFDTVSVTISDGLAENTFEYLVVCDPGQLRSFDINFIVLFVIAVAVVIIAIKTPPFLIFNDMTEEEQD